MSKAIADPQIEKIKELSAGGMEQKDIAKVLGISQSTVSKYVKMKHNKKRVESSHSDNQPYKSYGQRKAEEYIAAGGARVEVDPAWYFDRKLNK